MKKKGKITLRGLLFHAYHGLHAHERETGSKFEIDLVVKVNFDKKAFEDNLEGTINYEQLYTIAKEELNTTTKKLMEPIAYAIANRILNTFDKAREAKVSITKLTPAIQGPCQRAEIEIGLTR